MNKPKLYQMCDGYCPESTLEGKKVRMRLNNWDFYESEETGLQVALIRPLFAVILNFRGKGEFRSIPQYLDEAVDAEYWSPQTMDKIPFGETIFEDENEIIKYLATIPKDNINRKGIEYYALLANDILNNEELPYLAAKQSIKTMFAIDLPQYDTLEADRVVRARLALIDGFYSTNVNGKRLFGYDDIVESVLKFAESDQEFIEKLNEYLNNIKNFYDEYFEVSFEINDLIEGKYGINKLGKEAGSAKSLMTKYCYFISDFKFPIYDTIVNQYFMEIADRFNIDLNESNHFTSRLNKYVSKLSILNKKVNDINKLDNLIWLYGKVKRGSYSLIMTKDKYIELINKIDFVKENSREVDAKIADYIKRNIDELEKEGIFDAKQTEFIKFVMS